MTKVTSYITSKQTQWHNQACESAGITAKHFLLSIWSEVSTLSPLKFSFFSLWACLATNYLHFSAPLYKRQLKSTFADNDLVSRNDVSAHSFSKQNLIFGCQWAVSHCISSVFPSPKPIDYLIHWSSPMFFPLRRAGSLSALRRRRSGKQRRRRGESIRRTVTLITLNSLRSTGSPRGGPEPWSRPQESNRRAPTSATKQSAARPRKIKGINCDAHRSAGAAHSQRRQVGPFDLSRVRPAVIVRNSELEKRTTWVNATSVSALGYTRKVNGLCGGWNRRRELPQERGKYKAQRGTEVSSVINSRDRAISSSARRPTAHPGSFFADTSVSILKA